MCSKDKNLSLQFYNYLCDIVGSEAVVRARRDIFTTKDIVQNTTGVTFISSGSKAEGLDLKCSDYDQMMQLNPVRVYESSNDDQSNSDTITLVMDTNDTKPGFTKLKLVNKSDLERDLINDWCETEGEETFISSKRFREKDLPDRMVVHGPCHSTPGGEFDGAKCFRCNEWITPAQHWIHRSRTARQDDKLITSAIQYGVLFVPIGCKNSPNEDLQWRISFSVTEKLLVHFFPHTQLLCYALMKIILQDLMKPKHGDLLCSYFLKTIMFWLSEETNPSDWKPENMISCFLDCIRRLIYCVEYKTCLHYFIPENNLFEERFTCNDHNALLDTLRFVYKSPWTVLLHTETFLNYRLQSVNAHWMALSASALSCLIYIKAISEPYSIYRVLSRFGNDLNYISKKHMCAYILCVSSRESIQSYDFYNLTDRNKSFYKQYKRIFRHFKISLPSDTISSWLLLASLLYNCKQYHECLEIINYCLFSCTPDKIYLHFANSLAEQTVFKQTKHKLGLLLALKCLIIEDVRFRYPFNLLPDELRTIITGNILIFPPVFYSYLIQFLCCHHLGDNRGKQNALHDLELTIRERYFIQNTVKMLRLVRASLDIAKELL